MTGFIEDGGGFLGIGSAAQSEPGTDFFNGLIGARPSGGSSTTAAEMTVAVATGCTPRRAISTSSGTAPTSGTSGRAARPGRSTPSRATTRPTRRPVTARARAGPITRSPGAATTAAAAPSTPAWAAPPAPSARRTSEPTSPAPCAGRQASSGQLQGDDREQLRGREDRRRRIARRRARQQRRVARPGDRAERLGPLHRPRRLPHRAERGLVAEGPAARAHPRPRGPEGGHRLRQRARLGSRGGERTLNSGITRAGTLAVYGDGGQDGERTDQDNHKMEYGLSASRCARLRHDGSRLPAVLPDVRPGPRPRPAESRRVSKMSSRASRGSRWT